MLRPLEQLPEARRCSRRCAKFRFSLPLLAALRRAPPVDHRSSYHLRSLTGASNDPHLRGFART